jgi:hypothetical protein
MYKLCYCYTSGDMSAKAFATIEEARYNITSLPQDYTFLYIETPSGLLIDLSDTYLYYHNAILLTSTIHNILHQFQKKSVYHETITI